MGLQPADAPVFYRNLPQQPQWKAHDDDRSHFEDVDIELEDHGTIGHLSAPRPATEVIFRHTDGDYHYDWHNAPRRQYIVILEGGLEVEVGDGSRRVFRAGDALIQIVT